MYIGFVNKILLIHPDQPDRERLGSILTRAGFKVMYAEDNEHALVTMNEIHPDLIVMANDSPETRAMFCGQVSEPTPIMLLGTGNELTRATMLELGADMYVDVSVGQGELIARANALLRRSKKPACGG